MNAEWIEVVRSISLEASGGDDEVTINFETGTPYRHLVAWVKARVAGGDTVNVSTQAIFAGTVEGSAVVLSDSDITNVFQAGVDEIRPTSRLPKKHPDDAAPPQAPLWQLQLTNAAANAVTCDVYILAAASPGGT